MIPEIQAYKNTVSFQASVPVRKIASVSRNGRKAAVDKFIPELKKQNTDTIAVTLKNMFFEIFPNLDKDYRKMFNCSKINNV